MRQFKRQMQAKTSQLAHIYQRFPWTTTVVVLAGLIGTAVVGTYQTYQIFFGKDVDRIEILNHELEICQMLSHNPFTKDKKDVYCDFLKDRIEFLSK